MRHLHRNTFAEFSKNNKEWVAKNMIGKYTYKTNKYIENVKFIEIPLWIKGRHNLIECIQHFCQPRYIPGIQYLPNQSEYYKSGLFNSMPEVLHFHFVRHSCLENGFLTYNDYDRRYIAYPKTLFFADDAFDGCFAEGMTDRPTYTLVGMITMNEKHLQIMSLMMNQENGQWYSIDNLFDGVCDLKETFVLNLVYRRIKHKAERNRVEAEEEKERKAKEEKERKAKEEEERKAEEEKERKAKEEADKAAIECKLKEKEKSKLKEKEKRRAQEEEERKAQEEGRRLIADLKRKVIEAEQKRQLESRVEKARLAEEERIKEAHIAFMERKTEEDKKVKVECEYKDRSKREQELLNKAAREQKSAEKKAQRKANKAAKKAPIPFIDSSVSNGDIAMKTQTTSKKQCKVAALQIQCALRKKWKMQRIFKQQTAAICIQSVCRVFIQKRRIVSVQKAELEYYNELLIKSKRACQIQKIWRTFKACSKFKQLKQLRYNKEVEDKCCVICLEAPKTHIIIPCGHKCLCEKCALTITDPFITHACPICRNEIFNIFRVYE